MALVMCLGCSSSGAVFRIASGCGSEYEWSAAASTPLVCGAGILVSFVGLLGKLLPYWDLTAWLVILTWKLLQMFAVILKDSL